jgi:5-methylcytosine-specific restriction endonuclease McrA
MLKQKIPKALREQVWLKHVGSLYQSKCTIKWCQNTMTVFDFEAGHNIPESKGGTTTLNNLFPICSRCNRSMSNKYTIDEWNKFESKNNNNNQCCTIM